LRKIISKRPKDRNTYIKKHLTAGKSTLHKWGTADIKKTLEKSVESFVCDVDKEAIGASRQEDGVAAQRKRWPSRLMNTLSNAQSVLSEVVNEIRSVQLPKMNGSICKIYFCGAISAHINRRDLIVEVPLQRTYAELICAHQQQRIEDRLERREIPASCKAQMESQDYPLHLALID